jgi:hypothetical protein
MKRSEIISKLEDYLIDYQCDDWPDCTFSANEILTYLEKEIGMLPPPCTVTIKDGKHTPTERKWEDE